MRHKTETEQITRLLVQKPVAYAELGENARIALSVLGDDGWKVERIGMEMTCYVTTTPVDGVAAMEERHRQQMDTAVRSVEECQLRFVALRKEVKKANCDRWVYAFWACLAASMFSQFHHGWGTPVLMAACFAAYVWTRVRTEGAA